MVVWKVIIVHGVVALAIVIAVVSAVIAVVSAVVIAVVVVECIDMCARKRRRIAWLRCHLFRMIEWRKNF